jgi:hypothetical protein
LELFKTYLAHIAAPDITLWRPTETRLFPSFILLLLNAVSILEALVMLISEPLALACQFIAIETIFSQYIYSAHPSYFLCYLSFSTLCSDIPAKWL